MVLVDPLRIASASRSTLLAMSEVLHRRLDEAMATARSSEGLFSTDDLRRALLPNLRAAYDAAFLVGVNSASSQLVSHGVSVDVSGVLQPPEPEFFKESVSRLEDAISDLSESIDSSDSAEKRFRWRASLALDFVITRAYSDATVTLFSVHKVKKMWMASWASGHVPGPECVFLSGRIIEADESFPVPRGYEGSVFTTPLVAPPLHPRCRCSLVLVMPEKDPKDLNLKLPKVQTDKRGWVSSETIKKMPKRKFLQVLRALLALVVRFVSGSKVGR